MRVYFVRGFISLLFGLFTISVALAQETSTPPALPTKTPIPTTSDNTGTTPVAAPSRLLQPFTQADLAILTGNIQRPNGLAWFDGKLYVSCSGDWTIYEIDSASGITSQYIYGVKNAHTLYATSDGDRLSLWMPDFMSNTLVNIENGVSRVVATNLEGPWGIAPWSDGVSYLVTNLRGNTLIEVDSDGKIRELLSGLRSPTGVAVDGQYVYVANTGSARRAIEWIDGSTLADDADAVTVDMSEAAQPLVSGLQNTTSVVMGPDGLLYFSYALGTRGIVGRVDPEVCRLNGGCTNDQVEVVLFSELAAPLAGLTVSPDMELYVHTIFSPDIYSLSLTESPLSPN